MQKTNRFIFLSINNTKSSATKSDNSDTHPQSITRLAECEIDWEIHAQHALRVNTAAR
jgi:hypothetical protein